MSEDTLPTWPAGLPVGLLNGYGYQRDDTREVSNPEIGPPRIRVKSRSGKTQFTVPLQLSEEQFSQFEAFYEQILIAGSSFFLMPLRSATGMNVCEVFILKLGKATKINTNWRITLTIITNERV